VQESVLAPNPTLTNTLRPIRVLGIHVGIEITAFVEKIVLEHPPLLALRTRIASIGDAPCC